MIKQVSTDLGFLGTPRDTPLVTSNGASVFPWLPDAHLCGHKTWSYTQDMVKPTGVGQHDGIEDAELGEVQVELDQLGGKVDCSVDQLLPPAHGLDLLHRDGDLVSKPDHILHPHRPAHTAVPHLTPDPQCMSTPTPQIACQTQGLSMNVS